MEINNVQELAAWVLVLFCLFGVIKFYPETEQERLHRQRRKLQAVVNEYRLLMHKNKVIHKYTKRKVMAIYLATGESGEYIIKVSIVGTESTPSRQLPIEKPEEELEVVHV